MRKLICFLLLTVAGCLPPRSFAALPQVVLPQAALPSKPAQCMLPAIADVDPLAQAPARTGKTCGCSPACSCGCNAGLPCTCGGQTQSRAAPAVGYAYPQQGFSGMAFGLNFPYYGGDSFQCAGGT